MYEDNSHPPSGESSARQTPQPLPPSNKEVQATFAKQVVQSLTEDDSASGAAAAASVVVEPMEHHQQQHHHHHHHHHHHGPQLPPPQTTIDHHMEPQHPVAAVTAGSGGGFLPHNSPSQAVNSNYENIVQCSKLQVS